MGKKRSQNEQGQRETIRKLVSQRDDARRQLNEVLDGKYMLRSDHDTLLAGAALINGELTKKIAVLERDAREGNRHVYSELDAVRDHLRLTQDALKAKNEAYGEQATKVEQLQQALADNEAKRVHLEKLVAALEKRLTEESAEAARQTRKRLERKTRFTLEQQTYIGHLERTLRLFSSLPAVQSYLVQLKAAEAEGTLKVTRVTTAVMEAENIEAKRPVEVES